MPQDNGELSPIFHRPLPKGVSFLTSPCRILDPFPSHSSVDSAEGHTNPPFSCSPSLEIRAAIFPGSSVTVFLSCAQCCSVIFPEVIVAASSFQDRGQASLSISAPRGIWHTVGARRRSGGGQDASSRVIFSASPATDSVPLGPSFFLLWGTCQSGEAP